MRKAHQITLASLIAFVALLLLSLALNQAGTFAKQPPSITDSPMKGDGNCSWEVEADDARVMLQTVAGIEYPFAGWCWWRLQEAMLDINCDGTTSAVDALLLLRHTSRLPYAVPKNCAPIGSLFILS